MALKLRSSFRDVDIDGSTIRLRRDDNGVVHMRGADDLDFARAMGFAHACDRMLQMMLLRVIGRGQICEHLADDDSSLSIDVFMRRMGFASMAEREAAELSAEASEFLEGYCSGVNGYLDRYGRPWELSLTRYRPAPWTVSDSLMTAAITSYIGLAQTQEDLERFIAQALHSGMDPAPLKELFSPHLDGLSEEIVAVLRSVRLSGPLVPGALRFLTRSGMSGISSSNNWALAPHRTRSGQVLQCNDPHLEVNRLPAIWYEFVMETDQGVRAGVSMPGVPALVMGRTEHLSMGFTYGFMDTVDLFIEECRGGEYRRGEERRPFAVRTEIIRRKRHPDTTLTVYENDLGLLDTDPSTAELPDGHYLLAAWSGRRGGACASIEALRRVCQARTVPEAQPILATVGISCNWILGDTSGNIGYQQSGLLPARTHSGLYPVPAWEPDNLWQGITPAQRLASHLNPDAGFLVTANGDHNAPGGPLAVNASMGPYREDRIAQLLGSVDRHDTEGMKGIQKDLYSIQAERIMEQLRPCLPTSAAADILRSWDLRYDKDSQGATAFEAVYRELLTEIYGGRVFGKGVWTYAVENTGILGFYHHLFDRGLLKEGSPWSLAGNREMVGSTLQRVLGRLERDGIPPWGAVQKLSMENIFFAGRLPRLFGFDHGPVPLEGGRATVSQGNVLRAHGRRAVVAPSYRYIADMGSSEVHTSLAGGPSDRRLTRWYKSGVEPWLRGDYKVLAFTPPARKSAAPTR